MGGTIVPLKVPSHVTWWKKMYCGASAGQDRFVMLFVLCFTSSMFFPLYLPLHPYNVSACWNSHHTAPPARRASLPASAHSSSTYTLPNIHLRVLSFFRNSIFRPPSAQTIMKSSTQIRRTCFFFFLHFNSQQEYFCRTIGDQSFTDLFFFSFLFLMHSSHPPSQSLVCGVNFHYTRWGIMTLNGLRYWLLSLLFSFFDMHFSGLWYCSFLTFYTCLALDVDVCFASFLFYFIF